MADKFPKLVLSHKGEVIEEYPVDIERITIGRHADNSISIDDLAVSARHALIVTFFSRDRNSMIQDLGSTNGTLVNKKEIKTHLLQHGDIIEIGQHQLTYLDNTAQSPDEMEKTMIISGREAAASAAPPPPARLRMLNGPEGGKQIELTGPNTAIGEEGGQRAVIQKRSKGYFLTHLWGATFPLVNGRLIGAQGHALQDHDVIKVAGIKAEFLLG